MKTTLNYSLARVLLLSVVGGIMQFPLLAWLHPLTDRAFGDFAVVYVLSVAIAFALGFAVEQRPRLSRRTASSGQTA
jgi:putative copper export protein